MPLEPEPPESYREFVKRYPLVAFTVVLLLAAYSSGDDAAKQDKKKLQGTWVVVSGEMEGRSCPKRR